MSRHSWKTSVAAKQMPVFSLYRVMDEDANVTIWLKGAVQMSGGGSLAARCLSCCTLWLPGRGHPRHFVLELLRRACQDQALVMYVVGYIPAALSSLDESWLHLMWSLPCPQSMHKQEKKHNSLEEEMGGERQRGPFSISPSHSGDLGSKAHWQYKQ